MSADELRKAAETLRERATAATAGPWERGDRWHVQGSDHCRCDPEWGPAEARRMNINGVVMDAHIHRLPEGASWMHGIYSAKQARSGYYPIVVNDTDEYGYMDDVDATYIATMHPGVGRVLGDLLDTVAGALEAGGNESAQVAVDARTLARLINGGAS